MFKPIHENYTCPVDPALVVRVRVNPTGAQKNSWADAELGGCAACPPEAQGEPRAYCPDCAAGRERWGQAWVSIYGETRAAGLDLSSPAAALATITGDELPDEIVAWLLKLPGAVWAERSQLITKNLPGSSATGS